MAHSKKRDYFWNTLGVFIQSAISPLLLVAVARINGLYDTGVFAFAAAVAIVFGAIAMWGGRVYQVSDVSSEFSKSDYLKSRLLLTVVTVFAAAVFIVINHYDTTKSLIMGVLVLVKVVEALSDVLYGVIQVNNRLYLVGISMTVKTLLGFGVYLLLDVLTKNIVLSTVGLLCVYIAVTLVYDYRWSRMLEPGAVTVRLGDTARVVALIKRTFPIFVVMFLTFFALNIQRYFVDRYYPEENGYFGIFSMPITLIALLITFILQPNIVNMATQYAKGKYSAFARSVRTINIMTLGIGALVLVCTIAIGAQALQLIFNADFMSRRHELWIIVLGGILNAIGVVYINMLIVMRHPKQPMYILLGTSLASIAVAGFVIQRYGLMGAVIVYAATSLVQSVLLSLSYNLVFIRKSHDKKD